MLRCAQHDRRDRPGSKNLPVKACSDGACLFRPGYGLGLPLPWSLSHKDDGHPMAILAVAMLDLLARLLYSPVRHSHAFDITPLCAILCLKSYQQRGR